MSHSVMRKLLGDIHNSPFLTVMVDETTDISNKEQLTLVIWQEEENFEANEEFLGCSTFAAESIIASIKDILLRFEKNSAKIMRSVL